MTSRERIRAVLRHELPDRVPIDLGSTRVTGIQCWAYKNLRQACGLPDVAPRVFDLMQMLAEVDLDVLDAIGGDCVGLFLDDCLPFGLKPERWKPLTLLDGTEVQVPGDLEIFTDTNGDWLIREHNRPDGKVLARMPRTEGYYFDYADDMSLHDEIELPDLDAWQRTFTPRLDEEKLTRIAERARWLHENTDKAVVLDYFKAGLGGPFNLPDWMVVLYEHPDWVHECHRRQVAFHTQSLRRLLDRIADFVDVVTVSGADFGTQKGEMFSPEIFAALYVPYFAEINAVVHEYGLPTFYHCCGSIRRLLGHFVEMGCDIINPVQCSSANMDAAELKAEFGDRIIFWGGGIDTQKTLPFGSVEEVKRETAERVKIFGQGGGFVFNPVHNIQKDCPGENLRTMYETVLEVGKY